MVLPFVAPIVPTIRRQPFNDPNWLFEPKYDGFRGMVYLSRKSCTLYSKKRNVFCRFDELRRDICAELPRAEVKGGRPNLGSILHRERLVSPPPVLGTR